MVIFDLRLPISDSPDSLISRRSHHVKPRLPDIKPLL